MHPDVPNVPIGTKYVPIGTSIFQCPNVPIGTSKIPKFPNVPIGTKFVP